VTGVTWEIVNEMNAGHAKEQDGVTQAVALDLLRRNSAAAAAAESLGVGGTLAKYAAEGVEVFLPCDAR
jgi:hypothetical protein